MYQIKGHALILAAGAIGVIVSLEMLAATRPARPVAAPAPLSQSAAAREPVAEPALKPLPASTAQSRYTRVLLSPSDQEALAREIQRELQRVGCYRGAIDGSWGSNTRQAMGAFTVALKLRIPFEAPDESLLRLVQGQANKVCGGPELDPEQAAATPGAEPQPRLVQPPVEVKRPRRGPAADPADAKAPLDTPRVADNAASPPSAPRRLERPAAPPASPNAPPQIVRSLMQTVNGVLGPLGF